MNHKNITIVGAGMFGCVCARILADAGFKIRLVDKRDCVGGNAAAYYENGVEVHRYGSHIFHTGDDSIWKFVNQFAKFNQYQHHCMANHAGRKYFLPFNLTLLESFFDVNFAGAAEAERFMNKQITRDVAALGIDRANPKNLEEQAVALVGARLYEAFIKNYTIKQWNRDPKELDASIIKRLPIRYDCNINYYDDKYQGIPVDGYDSMFNAVINHSGIRLELGVNYGEADMDKDIAAGCFIIFTGAPDELFMYKFGALSWRSLRFETKTLHTRDFQGNATINYVDADAPFTRIHEFKYFRPDDRATLSRDVTVIQYEFPADWNVGKERYYPVASAENAELYSRYVKFAHEKYGRSLIFGGRLGMYKYFDMDDTIAAAMKISRQIIENQ